MIFYRKFEYFKVAAMNFKGSLFYMQRIINKKLRLFKNFVKAYIDDLITFSKDFDLHFKHLRKLFQLLKELKIIINSKKTFLNYLNVIFFEQKIDVFKLITTQKRIETLINIKFFIDLETLKRYLRLIK